jgi:hypothetical protein
VTTTLETTAKYTSGREVHMFIFKVILSYNRRLIGGSLIFVCLLLLTLTATCYDDNGVRAHVSRTPSTCAAYPTYNTYILIDIVQNNINKNK